MNRKNFLTLALLALLSIFLIASQPAAPIRCKEYATFISQYGTDDPTGVVLHDEIGGTFTWGRYAPGFYSIWSTVALPVDKTIISISGARGFIRPRGYPNEIMFYTWNPADVLADEIINNTWLSIRLCD